MSEKSAISWTHNTQNFWLGCDKCAPECAHCYIDRDTGPFKIFGNEKRPEAFGEVYLTQTWNDPHRWQKQLAGTNKYMRVFTCSLSDFFLPRVDNRMAPHTKMYMRNWGTWANICWRNCAWKVIKDTPNCVYLILTKRPERIMNCLPDNWGQGYPNVWLGTSVGCNLTLSKLDSLRKVPIHPQAARFISAEPLIEEIAPNINLEGFHWVIAGGESGSGEEYLWNPQGNWRREFDTDGRRTMKLEWAYSLMLKAKTLGLPFWFKQITAKQAGKGESVFGFKMHEVPNPPNGGVWIPEQ